MWQCYFLDNPPLKTYTWDGGEEYTYVDDKELRVGAMWYARDDKGVILTPEYCRQKKKLSDYYWKHNSSRPPIMVLLPCMYTTGQGKQQFCIDTQCYDESQKWYGGWEVTGTPPLITVQPSINLVGSYHGWLQGGQVSQDVDGRNYKV